MYPIEDYRQEIIDTVAANQVTLLTAETGAGKSTQVPFYLTQQYNRVVVTEPRRLAAVTLAQRVAEEHHLRMPEFVGYRTAYESASLRSTKLLYCTDGLELVREISSRLEPDLLVIDEVHEWNLNIEALVAWSRQQLKLGSRTKLLIMSATFKTQELSRYFWDCPVIHVPGREFPVTEGESFHNVVDAVRTLTRERRNVLIFQPGKREIDECVDLLVEEKLPVEIVKLHGEMESAEQALAFKSYKLPKVVVATNVAQTAVTIPDIDAVLDTRIEKRIELDGGVESLVTGTISKADAAQRKGRAGRTKEGVYHVLGFVEEHEMLDYPAPEIQRVSLDRLVLRLADAGYYADKLKFFHQPPNQAIHQAVVLLQLLGALDTEQNITELGRQLVRYPISPRSAKILVTAQKYGLVRTVAKILACIECGGLADKEVDYDLRSSASDDYILQLRLYDAAAAPEYTRSNPCPFKDLGIRAKNFFRARELYRRLLEMLNLEYAKEPLDAHKVTLSFLAGMPDLIWMVPYRHEDCYRQLGSVAYSQTRKADNRSPVQFSHLYIGHPVDIHFKTRMGYSQTAYLVKYLAGITWEDLHQVHPELCHCGAVEYTLSETWFGPCVLIQRKVTYLGEQIPVDGDLDTGKRFTLRDLVELKQYCESIGKPHWYLQIKEELLTAAIEYFIKDNGLRSTCLGKDPVELRAWAKAQLPSFTYSDPEDHGHTKTLDLASIMRVLNAYRATIQSRQVPVTRTLDEGINQMPVLEVAAERGTNLKIRSGLDTDIADWKSLGRRQYRCPNNHSTKVDKGATMIECCICGCTAQLA